MAIILKSLHAREQMPLASAIYYEIGKYLDLQSVVSAMGSCRGWLVRFSHNIAWRAHSQTLYIPYCSSKVPFQEYELTSAHHNADKLKSAVYCLKLLKCEVPSKDLTYESCLAIVDKIKDKLAKNLVALPCLVQNGLMGCAKKLLSSRAMTEHSRSLALLQAAWTGNLKMVQLISASGPIKKIYRESALQLAAENRHSTVVLELFDDHISMFARANTAYHLANWNLELAKFVLMSGPIPTWYQDLILFRETTRGRPEIAQFFEQATSVDGGDIKDLEQHLKFWQDAKDCAAWAHHKPLFDPPPQAKPKCIIM